MTDEQLGKFIDNYYFELKDSYERYGIEELYNFEIKSDDKGKYIIINEDGEYLFKEYLKDQPKKTMSLQEITKISERSKRK